LKSKEKMPKDNKTVVRIFRKLITLKPRKYQKNPEIFPEVKVRAFLGITASSSCCDGLVERINPIILSKHKNIKDYDLLELKGKHFDSIHKDIGQYQMNSTIGCFLKKMKPHKGISFIKGGPSLKKNGYRVKKGILYRLESRKPEVLENNIPLRVYYYTNNFSINRR